MIELIGLQKYYNKGKQNEIHVINDVSMNLPESGMCAIFGPSGCGKTTLLNVIGGLDDFETGVITVDGNSMEKHTDLIRNRYIGFIFQNYNLNKEETVFENVADSLYLCGMRDEAVVERRVMAALTNVGMDKFRKRLPDTLSGGQQQRVAIARAIVKNPRIILADEPTGNLDEANTVLVMDILKEMSKERLVLLVTHEEHLVDYYCDTVIELRDGQIVGTRTNESAEGFTVRDKNDIFLGEYQEETIDNEKIDVRYYGEKPEEPLRLTVVNHDGRLLLRIDSPKVSVIDEFSELKLREGVFTVAEQKERQQKEFDMSELPEFEGSRYGRLFDFKTSLKRGYQVNFKSMMKQKGKKRLRTTLLLFALVFVFMSAIFGTSLREFFKIDDQYNHNIFYVYAANDGIYDRVQEALKDSSSGIDYVTTRSLPTEYLPQEEWLTFYPSGFESFGMYERGESYNTTDVPVECVFIMPSKMVGNAKTIAGSTDCVNEGKMIITKAVADRILKDYPFDYLQEYGDLLGTDCEISSTGDGGRQTVRLRIGCVVDSEENAAYLSETEHAIYALTCNGIQGVGMDEKGYYNLQSGEVVFVKKYNQEDFEYSTTAKTIEDVKVGDTMTVRGKTFRVREIIDMTKPERDYEMENIRHEIENGWFEGFGRISEEEFNEYCAIMDAYSAKLSELASHIADSRSSGIMYSECFVIMSGEDYLECSNRAGLTSAGLYNSQYYYGEAERYGFQPLDPSDTVRNSSALYYAIHASDVKQAENYIKEHFGDISAPSRTGYGDNFTPLAIYTPDDIHSLYFTQARQQIVPFGITLLVIIAFMSVCMYFIMKSMIMNRTKEIGIYRAIGVTKKNVIFRFAVEAGVVVTLSVFIGYLIGSLASFYIQANSTLFYYPVWYALVVFAFLYALGIFCGIIPVLLILRKTPSAILAKYDI